MSAPTQRADRPRSAPTKLGRVFWLGFAVILLGEVLDLMDSLVTTIAGPSIRADLGGTDAFLQWLAAGYTLALAGGVLIGGRLGDRFGRRRLFLVGMAGFVLTSAVSALAPTGEVLMIARLAQGALGALMLPQSFGMIREMVPKDRMGAAFGAFGVTMGLAALAGPVLAGVLVSADLFGLGWRAIFWINVPLGILGLLLGSRWLPHSEPDRGLRIDLVGALLGLLAMTGLVFPLVEGRDLGWPWWILAMFPLAAVCCLLLVWWQRRRSAAGRDPLILPSVFTHRSFVVGLGISLGFFSAFMASAFVLGMVFQLGLGLSPRMAAVAGIPQAIGMVIGVRWSGRALSGRRQLIVGLAVALLGQLGLVAVLATQGGSLHWWLLAPALLVTGVGSGTAMGPIFDVVAGELDDHETGSASGVLNAVQQVGGATGVAALGTVLFAVAGRYGSPAVGLVQGAAWAYALAAALSALALLGTITLLPRTPK